MVQEQLLYGDLNCYVVSQKIAFETKMMFPVENPLLNHLPAREQERVREQERILSAVTIKDSGISGSSESFSPTEGLQSGSGDLTPPPPTSPLPE